MKKLFVFLLLSSFLIACKSSKDVAESTPSPAPAEVEVIEEEASDSSETATPQLETVTTTSYSEKDSTAANSTTVADNSNSENNSANSSESGNYRVQLNATMGSVFKPKYKGFNKVYFEESPNGSKVYVGENLSKEAAEDLKKEYQLRGFDEAFVVGMEGSGLSAGAKFSASESNTPLSANSGPVFLVQLMAYQGPNPPRQIKKLTFYQIIGFNDGFKRVYSGAYSSVEAARAGQSAYKKMGFKGCFVVPFEGYKNKLNNLQGEPIQ